MDEKIKYSLKIKQIKYYLVFFFTGIIIFCSGCAYFNTFYNARRYFEEGEKARLENIGGSLPSSAKNAYKSVIDKSILTLNKYPQSKYVLPAMLLIGKSRYHLGEYTQAENMFRQLEQEGAAEYQQESQYWLALTKWKSGKLQPALDDLHTLYDQINDNQFLAKIHLSVAEIYLEIEKTDQALASLEKAADLTKDRSEKDQIYYRLSTLAFDQQEYDRALFAYRNVIKYTMVKKRKEEANLQIVRVYRLKEDFKQASKKIKDLLADGDFETVHGDLELELVKIFLDQGEEGMAKTRLETITNDYKKTEVSAEAFYLLGENTLNNREFEEALTHFEQVSTESRKSEFIKISKRRIKEINAYQSARNELSELTGEKTVVPPLLDESGIEKTTKVDSLRSFSKHNLAKIGLSDEAGEFDSTNVDSNEANSQSLLLKQNQIAEKLYSLGELDAFHFDRSDSAIVHLQNIIENYPDTDLYLKSLFTLSFLFFERGDTTKGENLEDILLEQFPESEFSLVIRKRKGLEEGAQDNFLRDAEQLWDQDQEASLHEYKSIIAADSTSALAARAVYFLAHRYDYYIHNADSALKYYEMIQHLHPESEQASASKSRYSTLKYLLGEDSDEEIKIEKQSYVPKQFSLDSISLDIYRSISRRDTALKFVKQDSLTLPIDTSVIVP